MLSVTVFHFQATFFLHAILLKNGACFLRANSKGKGTQGHHNKIYLYCMALLEHKKQITLFTCLIYSGSMYLCKAGQHFSSFLYAIAFN